MVLNPGSTSDAEYATEAKHADLTHPKFDDLGTMVRLHALYANVIQRFLLATVATKSGVEGELITDEHEHLARRLLASAERCLIGENSDARDFRITLNRVAAGILLARRANDGARGGLVSKSAATQMRKVALKALLDAMPWLWKQEHDDETPDGPLRVSGSSWEVQRRTAEHEIVDLETALTN